MPKAKIPDRWECYSDIGKVITGTNFIAFKVPLKEELCRNISPREWFTPKILIERLHELGFVIDLTNTKRYYNPQELLEHNIMYEKIFCEGHRVPSREVTIKFFEAVDNFCRTKSERGRIIGVHCTHGLNRTGYLVCRYMIDKLGFSPEEAIKQFEKARGHKMERTEYIEALYNRNLSDQVTSDEFRWTKDARNGRSSHTGRPWDANSLNDSPHGEHTWHRVHRGEYVPNKSQYNSRREPSWNNSCPRDVWHDKPQGTNAQRLGFYRWNSEPLSYNRSESAPNSWTADFVETEPRDSAPSTRESRYGNRWDGQHRAYRDEEPRSHKKYPNYKSSQNRYSDRSESVSWPRLGVSSEESTEFRRHDRQSRLGGWY